MYRPEWMRFLLVVAAGFTLFGCKIVSQVGEEKNIQTPRPLSPALQMTLDSLQTRPDIVAGECNCETPQIQALQLKPLLPGAQPTYAPARLGLQGNRSPQTPGAPSFDIMEIPPTPEEVPGPTPTDAFPGLPDIATETPGESQNLEPTATPTPGTQPPGETNLATPTAAGSTTAAPAGAENPTETPTPTPTSTTNEYPGATDVPESTSYP